jgi:hypothetical protein
MDFVQTLRRVFLACIRTRSKWTAADHPRRTLRPTGRARREYRSIPFPVFLAGGERNEIFDSGAGLLQQRPTMNMPGALMMPQNPYALAAWPRNTPTAHGKLKLF